MPTLYPVSYGFREATLEEMKTTFGSMIHPEFARRGFNWLESLNGVLGIGSGIRFTQPTGDGFAPAGRSFHLRQKFRSGLYVYSSWDLVIRRPGMTHSSGAIPVHLVPLQGSAEAAKWGVHINVGRPGQDGFEVWHLQCVEQDGYDRWVNEGRPDPDPNYVIPGKVIPKPEPAPTPPVEGMVSVSTANLPVIREGTKGNHAKGLQNLLNDFYERMEGNRPLLEDGDFGQHSTAVLVLTQTRMGLTGAAADGVCGPETYGRLFTHLLYPG
jgi:hypothetical protein